MEGRRTGGLGGWRGSWVRRERCWRRRGGWAEIRYKKSCQLERERDQRVQEGAKGRVGEEERELDARGGMRAARAGGRFPWKGRPLRSA